ncbi:predicted protein [Nematostella vectensis]|uniref:EF-hand domain-containing protein n=1 Tax=Nematostella vectensis TaxID=45351 RepID=A7RKA7_NEMVE|nr:predicted protein [Nematostella vectensis]|eukprot:XP_001640277.1 predicted protein [Nematostella vectensis]
MAGFAPFGRDDQPLLDVKIVGGKRIEVEVDKYGHPLHVGQGKQKLEGSARFSRSLSEERNPPRVGINRGSSLPPWAREGTPPKKILKPLGSPARSESTASYSTPVPNSPKVLPPIRREENSSHRPDFGSGSDEALMKDLRFILQQFDTSRLKEAYMSFAGLDSTLTGFVNSEQVQQVFQRYSIPIQGHQLESVMSKFMSGRRPNWINYEQMLKFINNCTKPAGSNIISYEIPKLDFESRDHFSQNSPLDATLTMKPNQVSPRPVNDGSSTGRQSVVATKRAFQDRQDAHLLIEMERMLKQVYHVQDQIDSLYQTLRDHEMTNTEIISSQKLKTICLRHHLPFNGSLLEKIIDRLDPRDTGRLSWVEFMDFVERAIPLQSAGSSRAGRHEASSDLPPAQPTWETRQPLQAVPRKQEIAAMREQEDIYHGKQKLLDQQLTKQGEELAEVMNKQQHHLDRKHRALQKDHIEEVQRLERDFEDGRHSLTQWGSLPQGDQEVLEEQHRALLRQQFELIEQKRRIQEEQEELDRHIRNKDLDMNLHGDARESRVERFLRLANALFLCDKDASGFVEADTASRLVKNYNLVYQLDMPLDTIESAFSTCTTRDDMVNIDELLDQLKRNI